MYTKLDIGKDILKGKFKITNVWENGTGISLKCNKCGKHFIRVNDKPKCCKDSIGTKILNLFRW